MATLRCSGSRMTDQDIISSAQSSPSIKQWRKWDPYTYAAALRYRKTNPLLWDQCTAHMSQDDYKRWTKEMVLNELESYTEMNVLRTRNQKLYTAFQRLARKDPDPTFKAGVLAKLNKAQHDWGDGAELRVIARQYQHKQDFKKGNYAAYQAALHRGREFYESCCAHMTPKANPYRDGWYVYVCEFEDHHVYVGITWDLKERMKGHYQEGPVFEHLKVCPIHTFKVLEHVKTRVETKAKEAEWQAGYPGWTPLHSAVAGSLGGLCAEWTKPKMLAEARLYRSVPEFMFKNRYVYQRLKRMGWFEEATPHMPKDHYQRWNEEKIWASAKTFKEAGGTYGDWAVQEPKAYTAARRLKVLEAVKAWWQEGPESNETVNPETV